MMCKLQFAQNSEDADQQRFEPHGRTSVSALMKGVDTLAAAF